MRARKCSVSAGSVRPQSKERRTAILKNFAANSSGYITCNIDRKNHLDDYSVLGSTFYAKLFTKCNISFEGQRYIFCLSKRLKSKISELLNFSICMKIGKNNSTEHLHLHKYIS